MIEIVFVIVQTGPLAGYKYLVKTDSPILVGRSEDAIIRIGYDAFCSRRHALIYWKNGKCRIRDLNSTNGTYVNGVLISDEVKLNINDNIKIGSTEFKIFMTSKKSSGGINADIDEGVSYE